MTYLYSDFTNDVLKALGTGVPSFPNEIRTPWAAARLADAAKLALAKIASLKAEIESLKTRQYAGFSRDEQIRLLRDALQTSWRVSRTLCDATEADECEAVLRALLECAELNQDDIEPATAKLIGRAMDALGPDT
jgi:hypothetical protein